MLNEILENAGWVYGIIMKDIHKLLAGPFRVTILMPLADRNPRRELNCQGVTFKVKYVGVVMSPTRRVDLRREGRHGSLQKSLR